MTVEDDLEEAQKDVVWLRTQLSDARAEARRHEETATRLQSQVTELTSRIAKAKAALDAPRD